MATAITLSLPCPHPVVHDGDCFALEVSEAAGGERRPQRTLRLDVLVQVTDGIVYVVADEDEAALTPGDSMTVAAGTPYRAWNAGDDQARWVEIYG
ncbi:MAG: cupin domain-containing protein [Thermoleophilaceae bacterium]